MEPGERFRNWMSDTGGSFADRLKFWLNVVWGVLLRSTVGIVIPPTLLAKLFPATEEAGLIVRDLFLGFVASITAAFTSGLPQGRYFSYAQDRLIKSYRFDPLSAVTAWRRDNTAYAKMFEDLKDQGWSDERIESLKFVTQYMPTPQQAIAWLAHEVFEPEMISKYGLDSEFGGLDLTIPRKIGMTDEMSLNEWRNHWQHASWMQVVEMLHRGLLTEAEVWEWFRLVEIPPFWRQSLIDSAYTWPTRVDVRRWWDMRTIDETELRRLYSGMGYRGVNLDNYVLWTKVYTEFPSLLSRWQKGWLTLDEVRAELTGLGMPAARVETMIQEKIRPEEPERVEDGKDFTKSEIYKGVKQGVIADWEGIELIMDLGYTRAEAEYLIDINVAVLTGSPETFAEFKDLTTKWRIATGKEATPMPEELKRAADEVVRVSKEVASLEEAIKLEEDKLLAVEVLPEEATAQVTELRVTLHRAEAKLQRVKQEYDRQVAEWKHTLT